MKSFAFAFLFLLSLATYSEAIRRLDNNVSQMWMRQFFRGSFGESKVVTKHILGNFRSEASKTAQASSLSSDAKQSRPEIWTKGVHDKPAYMKLSGLDLLGIFVPKAAERLQSVHQSSSVDGFVHPSDRASNASPLEAFTSSPIVKALLRPAVSSVLVARTAVSSPDASFSSAPVPSNLLHLRRPPTSTSHSFPSAPAVAPAAVSGAGWGFGIFFTLLIIVMIVGCCYYLWKEEDRRQRSEVYMVTTIPPQSPAHPAQATYIATTPVVVQGVYVSENTRSLVRV